MTEPDPAKPPAPQSGDPAHPAGTAPPVRAGMFLLELMPVPVSDIDRSKAYYSERLGFHADVDVHLDASAHALADIARERIAAAYRQPSAGATWVRMLSMTWAL